MINSTENVKTGGLGSHLPLGLSYKWYYWQRKAEVENESKKWSDLVYLGQETWAQNFKAEVT